MILGEIRWSNSTFHDSLGHEIPCFQNKICLEQSHLSVHGPELSIIDADWHSMEIQVFWYHTSRQSGNPLGIMCCMISDRG
jgi:hypothetical protein